MNRDQLIETMARAIYRAKWGVMLRPDPEREEKFWRMEVSNVTAALTALEAAGMLVVPVAAYSAMLHEMYGDAFSRLAAQEDSTSE